MYRTVDQLDRDTEEQRKIQDSLHLGILIHRGKTDRGGRLAGAQRDRRS